MVSRTEHPSAEPPAGPVHALPAGFEVVGGVLQVGGQSIERLAARVGQTPFYVYDRSVIQRRIADLRETLPEGVSLHYAVKANPMPALLGWMVGLVDGLDVASAGELKLALDAGCRPGHVSFAGPGKRESELRQAVAAGVLLNVESEREVARLAAIARETGWTPRVAIRINPPFELKGAGMSMGGGPKPFGIDAEQVPELLAAVARSGLAFEGFQVFAGSSNLRADAVVEAQMAAVELSLALAAHAPGPLRSVNVGGGLGIPYFPGDRPIDVVQVSEGLRRASDRLRQAFPGASLVIELGRYLVGEAGLYVTRVVDRKVSRGHPFLVVDGGLHHHLAATGNFGQVIRKNYPVAIGNRMDAMPAQRVTVVGPLCTPLDILADKMLLPAAEVGDLVVIFQSGAYGATASPQAFLAQGACPEVLV